MSAVDSDDDTEIEVPSHPPEYFGEDDEFSTTRSAPENAKVVILLRYLRRAKRHKLDSGSGSERFVVGH